MSQYVNKIRTTSGDLQIDYNALANLPDIPIVDDQLVTYGQAADAKSVGDKFTELNSDISTINTTINTIDSTLSDMPTKEYVDDTVNDAVDSLFISNPNLLINGDFQVWQRGTSFANKTNSYTADRWCIKNGKNTPTALVEKSDDVPDDQYICQSIHIKESDSENSYLRYYFDSVIKGNVTLSFWYKTTKAFDVSIRNNNTTTILPGKPAIVNTWTRYVHSFAVDSPTYLNVVHAMSAGDVYITGVKLEYGEVATPFVPKTYQEELESCQNYFQKINLLYKPGVTNNSGAFVSFSCDTKLRSVDGITPTVTIDTAPTQLRTTESDAINTELTLKSASYYRGYLVIDFNSSTNLGAKAVAWPIADFKISVSAEIN